MRQNNITFHPLQLGGSSGNAVVFLNRELQRTQGLVPIKRSGCTVKVQHILHGALAECLTRSHDDGLVVVLQGGGYNLGGRSGSFIDHHQQRPIPHGTPRAVVVGAHALATCFDLNDGAFVKEQARDVHGSRQGTAAVPTQIKNEAFHPLCFENFDLFFDIVGTIAVVVVVKVDVEFRQADVARFTVCSQAGRAGKGGFNLHDVANDGNDLFGAVLLANGEAHFRTLLPPNLGHHFVGTHAHDVLGFGRTLGHLDDFVAHFQFPLAPAGRTSHDRGHAGELAILLKRSSNAFELPSHFNFEVFLLARREVLGVGIQHAGVRIHVETKPVRTLHVRHAAEPLIVDFHFFFTRLLLFLVKSGVAKDEFGLTGRICRHGSIVETHQDPVG